MYGNARDFCELIFYPETLSPSSFLAASLVFSTYHIMSSAIHDSFISFPVCILFISFSSLIGMTRASKTILNNNSKCEHPCHVPDLRGNAFSFSLLRMIFAMSLSYMAFIMLR